MKREVEMDKLLENCPVELLAFAEHLTTLNYYIRPDYSFLYHLLEQVLNAGNIKFSDPYDWEKNVKTKISSEVFSTSSDAETATHSLGFEMPVGRNRYTLEVDPDNPFPSDFFAANPLGF
ncbi:hypothetical protein GCK32_012536 [Trichostrongylus colubriformis]|uniref:Uncharacterized protein n=1 Tax=Trichostrongylus colubriformis TaxID=6319 RepID=A0AAN8FD87_TRICO